MSSLGFDEITPWLGFLLQGLLLTVELSLVASVLTVIASVGLATCGVYRASPWPGRISRFYCDLLRCVPLLALLIFIYFWIGPMASHMGIGNFWLAVLGLTLVSAAYQGEVYRASLKAIPEAQWEAAASLGLGWFATLRLVVAPQALPASVPTTLNLLIYTIKGSSLASLIAVGEITQHATLVVSITYLPFQTYIVVAAIYLAVIVPLTLVGKRLESRLTINENRHYEKLPVVAGEPELLWTQ